MALGGAFLLFLHIRRSISLSLSLLGDPADSWGRKKQQEYVRIAIEKSLNRQVVMGPTLSEKRGRITRSLLRLATLLTLMGRGCTHECSLLLTQLILRVARPFMELGELREQVSLPRERKARWEATHPHLGKLSLIGPSLQDLMPRGCVNAAKEGRAKPPPADQLVRPPERYELAHGAKASLRPPNY